ncbi:hypothetical protein HK101_005151 [Irineochytrium annulatum]|nr:hypothetical protein HK101_005151 [Irineochytrium annulatum]
MIISWLNPESLLDRTTLVRCLRVSTFFLELSAPILWSNQALLDNRIGIEGRSTGGLCDMGMVLKAVGDLKRSIERSGTDRDDRLAWRWKIYFGAVKRLRILPQGRKGTLFLMAASVAPWIGRVDEIILEVVDEDMLDDRGDWQQWLDARWSSNEVPKALTLLEAGWTNAEATRYACHKAVTELSLIGTRSRLLRNILAARQSKLDVIRVTWLPLTDRHPVRIMESLRDYKLENVGSLTTIDLTSQGKMVDIPDGLPVTSLSVGVNSHRFMAFSMAAARDSLRTLTVRDSDFLMSSLKRWLPEMNVLREVTLDMPRVDQGSLLQSMHGMTSLRSLNLNLCHANTALLLSNIEALAKTVAGLSELSLIGSCTELGLGFDPVVRALPRLETLTIELTGKRGRVSLPLGLRKLALSGMALEVDCNAVESERLPFLEYTRLIGVAVEDASGTCINARFMEMLQKKTFAPRLCFLKFVGHMTMRTQK